MPTVSVGFDDGEGNPSPDELAQYGPTLYVQIGFDPSYDPSHADHPNLPGTLYPVLVDTGAMTSCIDSDLAMSLGLPIVDREVIVGVHGPSVVNVHLAQIYVPDLEFIVSGRFSGVHLTAGGQRHFALLGRTFLRNFTMTYEGRAGIVTISND